MNTLIGSRGFPVPTASDNLHSRMRFPLRYLVPVLLAFACTGAILIVLWWQVFDASKLLQTHLTDQSLDDLPKHILRNVPVDPRDTALLHLRQGDLLALRGEWSAAETEYEQAVKAEGGVPALRKLALAQMQRRNTDGARSTVRQLKKAGARAEDVLLLESILELRSGELVKAKDMLMNAPDSPQKNYGLALLAVIQGNHEEARQKLEQVVNGWEPTLRAYARTVQGAYDEYALFPESPDIHRITLLSRALAQIQECELALPLLLQVTQMQDDYRDAWIVQGYCELVTERFEQALASLEQAYTLDPQKPETQYFLARTYASLGDHENAITFYEYALTNGFEPETEVRQWIARSALAMQNTELALEQYKILASAENATLEPYALYVRTCLETGKIQEAIFFATEAAKRWPEEAGAHELLGSVLAQAGQKEEARAALQKAMRLDPYLLGAQDALKKLQ